jgi:hypothetical protein
MTILNSVYSNVFISMWWNHELTWESKVSTGGFVGDISDVSISTMVPRSLLGSNDNGVNLFIKMLHSVWKLSSNILRTQAFRSWFAWAAFVCHWYPAFHSTLCMPCGSILLCCYIPSPFFLSHFMGIVTNPYLHAYSSVTFLRVVLGRVHNTGCETWSPSCLHQGVGQ